jgi:hypothetical protein
MRRTLTISCCWSIVLPVQVQNDIGLGEPVLPNYGQLIDYGASNLRFVEGMVLLQL